MANARSADRGSDHRKTRKTAEGKVVPCFSEVESAVRALAMAQMIASMSLASGVLLNMTVPRSLPDVPDE
jgi:hypothetical protein